MSQNGAFLFLLFEVFTIGICVLAFVYLFILSIVVNDYKLIVERPFLFTIELIFMMILPSIPILFFAVSRSMPLAKAILIAGTFALQAGVFHIVFQLSGVYSHSFGA